MPQKSKTYRAIRKNLESNLNKIRLNNIGPISLEKCIYWYKRVDFVFLPTVLEVFSATYIEAMKFQKVIITTDMKFAKEICLDSAIYFEPNDYNDAADKILGIISIAQHLTYYSKIKKKKIRLLKILQ